MEVLGRSEVAIGLTRRLGRVEVGEFAPLWCYMVFLFIFFSFSDAPSPCASSLDNEIIYYDINTYYAGPLALNSYFISIDIFIYSIYPV